MPPATKKRKVLVATIRGSAVPTQQQGIARFGRISKSQGLAQVDKKEVLAKTEAVDSDVSEVTPLKQSTRKRQLEDPQLGTPIEDEVEPQDGPLKPSLYKLFDKSQRKASPSNSLSPLLPKLPVKPITPQKKPQPPCSRTTETPTLGARTYLSSLALSSASSSPSVDLTSSPLPPKQITSSTKTQTPPTSPLSAKSPCPIPTPKTRALPEELQDLIDLHSSFLTALLLHYAHHGSLAPVDFRELRPGVERAWGKRRVEIDDVRRLFAILENDGIDGKNNSSKQSPCPLILSDYGHGKSCIELSDTTRNNKSNRRPLNVEGLNFQFSRNLQQQWQTYTNSHPSPTNIIDFIASLPLTPTTPCTSLTKISPLLAKGQRRLTDLKAGAIKAQITNNNINIKSKVHADAAKPAPRPAAITSRSSDLLTRILAKQLHQSTLPLPPSPETLARKSALQRLGEVISVLELLVASGSRSQFSDSLNGEANEVNDRGRKVSFTMPTLVQHMQMSLRNPISKDEATRCMKLMAEEIAPEWIAVREIGKVVGVTARRTRGIERDVMADRIQKALGGSL